MTASSNTWQPTPRQLLGPTAVILALHLLGWGILLAAIRPAGPASSAITLATGGLAYLLGLRHAFDADHITAIDNTTRRLLTKDRPATSVGTFFALGHSTVVFVATVLLALGLTTLGDQLHDENSPLRTTGALVGGTIAAAFLLLVAILNISTLTNIIRTSRQMRAGDTTTATLDDHADKRGVLNRLFAPLARTIDRPSKMYTLGVLFGLGFDTATSIGLLALAGTNAAAGGNIPAMLALPLIFAAGMTLGDTIDGLAMNHAYGWALTNPARKVFYNITITGTSIMAALTIAAIILSDIAVNSLNVTIPPLTWLAQLDLENVGLILAGLLLGIWLLAALTWKLGRFEQRWPTSETSHNRV